MLRSAENHAVHRPLGNLAGRPEGDYSAFLETGGAPPAGVKMLGRWHTADGAYGFASCMRGARPESRRGELS